MNIKIQVVPIHIVLQTPNVISMKTKSYLIFKLIGALVPLLFVMCAKKSALIESPVTAKTTAIVKDSIINTTINNGLPTKVLTSSFAVDPSVSCSYTVQPSDWFVDGTDIAPGSVICIPAGTRGALLLKNLKGTPAQPIIIINKGGRVTFSTTLSASYGFKTQNCKYFKVLGSGSPSIKYGFDITGGNIGMTMDDLSSDFEIANVEVRNSGFAGIMAKTDPSCDVATQRGHFTMSNVLIHDNYVHQTGGEGLYIGNSFYADGRSLPCGTVYPHDIVNLRVYLNITDSTGCEGIQVGSAVSAVNIYCNTVKMPGLTPFASGQNNGIQLGEGTGGYCYNNVIKNAPGNGIIVLGIGNNIVFNNYIINSGAYGIFADSRYTPGPYFQLIHNTIINPGLDGIKLNSESIPMNIVVNNAIIIPGSGVAINRKSSDVKLTAAGNYVGKDISELKFVNFDGNDFHLQPTSPLINSGANALIYGMIFDYYGKLRPVGLGYDAGATEYQGY